MRARIPTAVTAIASLALLAACGDVRLDKLSLGISKDSAAAAIGEPPHREVSYQSSGKLWEVQFYARGSVNPKDSIRWRKMSPVVFIDHKAVGWGWSWWGGAAKKQNIAMPSDGE
jgi:hypothetical protein